MANRRQYREDALDIGHEAHVEHAVSLVEHQDADLREVDALLLEMIEKATGCGDHDFNARVQRLDLRLDVDTTINHRRPQR